jgi:hypothetical protein
MTQKERRGGCQRTPVRARYYINIIFTGNDGRDTETEEERSQRTQGKWGERALQKN